MAAPDKLRIPLETEEYARFDCIGRLEDGRQFLAFVTGAFPGEERFPDPSSSAIENKQWVAVLHLFDEDGNHIRTETQLGGTNRDDDAGEKAYIKLDAILAELGFLSTKLCDVYIRPFSIELDGITYELVYENTIDEEDGFENECVMLWPNDIMFHPPWDSGEYST
jgi:hypothetical protein